MDLKTRQLLRQSRLSQLECDNSIDDQDQDIVISDGDDDEQVAAVAGTSGRRATKQLKKTTKRQKFGVNTEKKINERKTVEQIVLEKKEELSEALKITGANYVTAQSLTSRYPVRPLCSVCGTRAPHSCAQCGARFCCVKCMNTHRETRCMRFVR